MSIPGSGCAADYTSPVVYEPLWLRFPASQGWLEVGTAYSCGNVRYRYSYECNNGSCAFGTTYPLTNGGVDIRFRVFWSTSAYALQIGSSTLAWSYHQGQLANRIDVGLENHAGSVTIRRQDHRDLAYSLDFNPAGITWAGFDGSSVGAPACGGWYTASQWYSGRNATC
jgi:hypothetical protein